MVVGASMLGLRDVLEGPRDDQPAIVREWAGEPPGPGAVSMRIDPDNPSDSIILVRPWLLRDHRDDHGTALAHGRNDGAAAAAVRRAERRTPRGCDDEKWPQRPGVWGHRAPRPEENVSQRAHGAHTDPQQLTTAKVPPGRGPGGTAAALSLVYRRPVVFFAALRAGAFLAGALRAAALLGGRLAGDGLLLGGGLLGRSLLRRGLLGRGLLRGGGTLPESTASLNDFNGVIFADRLALMRIVSPVAGLRPMRAGRSTRRNFANPEMATSSPAATVAVIRSTMEVSTASASRRVVSMRSESAVTSWLRFTFPPSVSGPNSASLTSSRAPRGDSGRKYQGFFASIRHLEA